MWSVNSFPELYARATEAGLHEALTQPFATAMMWFDESDEISHSKMDRLGAELAKFPDLTLGAALQDAALHKVIRFVLKENDTRELISALAEFVQMSPELEATEPATRAQPLARLNSSAVAQPTTPDALTAWADANGVGDDARALLCDLPIELFPPHELSSRDRRDSVAEEFHGPDDEKPARGITLRSSLWAWLRQGAAEVAESRKRGPGTRTPPTNPALAALHRRLLEARVPLYAAYPERDRSAVERKLACNFDLPAIGLDIRRRERSGTIAMRDTIWPKVELLLAGNGPVVPSCNCADDPCPHLAIALDAAMDLLEDTHPSGDAARTGLSQTGWQRALGEAPVAKAISDRPTVSFEVRFEADRFFLTPRLHRTGKRGTAGAGVVSTPLEVLEKASLTSAQRHIAEQLVLAAHAARVGAEGGPDPFISAALLGLVGQTVHAVGVAKLPSRPQPAEVLPGPAVVRRVTPRFEVVETPAGLRCEVFAGDLPLTFDDTVIWKTRTALLATRHVPGFIDVIDVTDDSVRLISSLARQRATFPPEAHDVLLARLEAMPGVELQLPPVLSGEEVPLALSSVVRVEQLGSEGIRVQLMCRPLPEGEPVMPAEGPVTYAARRAGNRVFTSRAFEAESLEATRLADQLGLPHHDGFGWEMTDPHDAIEVIGRLEQLSRSGLAVEWPKKRWRLSRAAKLSDLSLAVRAKGDWFGLEGSAKVDDARLEIAAILDAVRRRRRWVRIDENQWLTLSEELLERLAPLANVATDSKAGLEITWAALPAIDALRDDLQGLDAAVQWQSMLDRARTASRETPALPANLNASLRDYQRAGFEWLSRLSQWGAGACLADDMGLGKTVQAIALLLARAESGPQLVVAPTSVVFNWREELTRFAPSLKVHDYRTADRAASLTALGPHDVLLVSWGLLAKDAEALSQVHFTTAVFDEAQAIKNASTQRAQAARTLNADFRVGLSGTPLENHLGELWSLFRVVLPGLFGSLERFRNTFAKPIERTGDPIARAALAALVRPFLLRRTKPEVALELPDRTDVSLHIELSTEEKRLYDDARLAAVAELTGVAAPEKKRFEVLAALTRLRLLACHPRLYDDSWSGPTSKLTRLLELVHDLKEGGHRALIFSQFTSHLALVKDALIAAGITFHSLDGSTPAAERQRLVESFQKGERDLFLISLKAGGVGLNLTAADYVVHLDPWWNPAVEDQATGRVHRIGQTRPVTVYRLISAGTVEESMLALHADKRNLVAGVLDGTGAAASMSADELLALVRGTPG